MTGGQSIQFGESLVYEDRIPLSWQEAEGGVSNAERLRTHDANERVLRCLAALDEYHTETPDEDQGHGSQDLARVEFKINLLLDLVARVVVHHMSVPDPVPVRIGAAAIQWETHSAPPLGQYLRVDLYLNPKYPSPVTLFGVVRGVDPTEAGYQVEMSYRDMSETVQGWIEKLIFRQHRRLVAQARHGGDRSR